MTDSSTGKLETLGSSFSNETALAGCLRLNATIRKILSFYTQKRAEITRLFSYSLNYREATSTLTPGPKVVVTETLRTY